MLKPDTPGEERLQRAEAQLTELRLSREMDDATRGTLTALASTHALTADVATLANTAESLTAYAAQAALPVENVPATYTAATEAILQTTYDTVKLLVDLLRAKGALT